MPIPKSQPLRPSPLTPNNLELAILRRFADMEPSIQRHLACIRGNLSRLHVLSRKYTGFGSFTEFQMESLKKVAITSRVSLDLLVSVPGVPNGMGAVIHLKDGLPEALETFTYGEDHWDGTFEGFSIQGAQRPTADATISPLRG